MPKHNATGRSRTGHPFVQLFRYMLNSAAWLALSPSAVKVYIAIAKHFDGINNGRILFSARMGVSECGLSKDTVRKAFCELERLGFIICTKRGAFSYKIRHASEWRLTVMPCNVANLAPTKEFMSWRPINLKRGTNFSPAQG